MVKGPAQAGPYDFQGVSSFVIQHSAFPFAC